MSSLRDFELRDSPSVAIEETKVEMAAEDLDAERRAVFFRKDGEVDKERRCTIDFRGESQIDALTNNHKTIIHAAELEEPSGDDQSESVEEKEFKRERSL